MTKTALVVVHPKSAINGPSEKLSLQWMLIGDWDGPVFILDDDREVERYSASANTYLDVIDVAVDERECTGAKARVNADDEAGLLEDACLEIANLHPEGDFLITGAWREDCVSQTAFTLQGLGRSTNIDGSAIGIADVDK